MSIGRLARWRRSLEAFFPERHLYVRSGGEMRGYVLTTSKQLMAAAAVAVVALWLGVSTAANLVNLLSLSSSDREMAELQARSDRWVADREARLNSAMAQLKASNGTVDDLALSVERRHQALAMLLGDLRGAPGASAAIAPSTAAPTAGESPLERIQAVRLDQERLINAAETYAKSRAERLRLALRLAGLDPSAYAGANAALGGPLIEARDPRALAAILDVDEAFAERIQRAARNMSEARALTATAGRMPLARPAVGTSQSSGFGARFDPFTGRVAFHSGLDFAGPLMTPVYATAPGVVSFAGVRSGYGNCIEIDHGNGFKTRYAHLKTISVTVGQRVGVGARIGGIGSTGRSTGPHLHYEVWVNGRAQNPARFLRAGEYVQQAN